MDGQIETRSERMTNDEIVRLIDQHGEPISDLANHDWQPLLDRIGDSRLVLLGECTHGTKEFYDLRAQISMELVRKKGFNLIALEADWPDVEGVNSYIHGRKKNWDGFSRFPEWMWRNHSFENFVEQLRTYNSSEANARASIFGLDIYSMSSSLDAVKAYFQKKIPDAKEKIQAAHACLHPWQFDPSRYGLAVWKNLIESCEDEVMAVLQILHEKQMKEFGEINRDLFSALQNTKVVKNAESYYRMMYKGSVESWNLRDDHMFETLLSLLYYFGEDSKVIIWEHNSHLGNARATQMGDIGERNVGELCKSHFEDKCYSIGFLSDHGTVAAADYWDGPMQIKNLRPARGDSYEFLFHSAQNENLLLPLRKQEMDFRQIFNERRLERAVGVLYLPETERSSHYFFAKLADQFDEICWLDETHAVDPLPLVPETEAPDTYPFGI